MIRHFKKLDGLYYGYVISPETGKIRFQYQAGKDLSFDFGLLCEVGEPWQLPYKFLLEDDHIQLGIYDQENDYCNIVTNLSEIKEIF